MNLHISPAVDTPVDSFVPVAASNGVIEHSGAEDVGFRRIVTDAFRATVNNSREAFAREESTRNRAAENAARNRRIDKDRLVAAALDFLESEATRVTVGGSDYAGYFLAGAAGIAAPTSDDTLAYVAALLTEIRASLSPLATLNTR